MTTAAGVADTLSALGEVATVATSTEAADVRADAHLLIVPRPPAARRPRSPAAREAAADPEEAAATTRLRRVSPRIALPPHIV
jgi:hypothetical protein